MGHSDQGIVKDDKAQEQPTDKERAQKVHRSDPDKSVSHEGTRDPSSKTKAGIPASRQGPV